MNFFLKYHILFKNITLLFFSLNLFLFAAAQPAIHFKLIDVETTKPLEGVSITIPELKLVKITGENGLASFTNIQAGNYDVEFSLTGYEKVKLQLYLSINYTDTTIVILLKPEEKNLQQV